MAKRYPYPRPLTKENVLDFTKKNGDCLEWLGARSTQNYGQAQFGGGGEGLDRKPRRDQVHRKVFEFFHGPIPAGMQVCHKCDNPPCINPDHLFVGTARDNKLDAKAKGLLKPRCKTRPSKAVSYVRTGERFSTFRPA